VRVRILEALASRPIGFAEVKKSVGIRSSVHLRFHLRMLGGLIRDRGSGDYLTDDGREALGIFRTTSTGVVRAGGRKPRLRLASEKAAVQGFAREPAASRVAGRRPLLRTSSRVRGDGLLREGLWPSDSRKSILITNSALKIQP
jgi:hypothetical protein